MMLWKRMADLLVTYKLRIAPNAIIEVNGSEMTLPITLNYTSALVTQTIFTASRTLLVKVSAVIVAGSM